MTITLNDVCTHIMKPKEIIIVYSKEEILKAVEFSARCNALHVSCVNPEQIGNIMSLTLGDGFTGIEVRIPILPTPESEK